MSILNDQSSTLSRESSLMERGLTICRSISLSLRFLYCFADVVAHALVLEEVLGLLNPFSLPFPLTPEKHIKVYGEIPLSSRGNCNNKNCLKNGCCWNSSTATPTILWPYIVNFRDCFQRGKLLPRNKSFILKLVEKNLLFICFED